MSDQPQSASPLVADDGAWRDRLLASLHDCGVEPAPRHAVWHWTVMIVGLLVILLVTLIGRLMIDEMLRTEPELILKQIIFVAWLLFAIFILNRLRNRFLRNATQSTARSAEAELRRSGLRRPILYLRSFALDQRIQRASWMERFIGTIPLESAEQELTRTLKKVGPTVAIGRPGEKLPGLGAARFYCSDDRWQQKVADVARESRFIVWASGVTEGLRWEISHLVETTPPEKLLLWPHPQILRLSPRQREAEWSQFRAKLGDAFPKPLPERLGEARFFYFTAGWEPHAVAPRRRFFPWLSATRATLKDLLALKTGTARGSRLRRWGARLGVAGVALLLGAILAAVVAPTIDDHHYERIRDGVVAYQYGHANQYHAGGMLANVGLALLAVSLIWNRWTWLRRTRLVLAGGLAIVAVACAALAVQDERASRFTNQHDESPWSIAKVESTEHGPPPPPPIVEINTQNPTWGVYFKLGLSLALSACAGGFVKTRWWLPAERPLLPPTDADLAYAGPGNDTFAELIGASGPAIVWPRVGGLLAALVALRIPPTVWSVWEFHREHPLAAIALSLVYTCVWAVLLTAAAVVAFHYLRSMFAPAVAAMAAVVAYWPIGRIPFSMQGIGQTLITTLILLAGLSWSVRRMAPRPWALWCGAIWPPLVILLLAGIYGDQTFTAARAALVPQLLGAALLAAVLELVVRVTPPEAAHR